jgi:hypothetical protein
MVNSTAEYDDIFGLGVQGFIQPQNSGQARFSEDEISE